MDEKLLERVNQAVHSSLMQMVRAITAAGMDPVSAVSLVRGRLDIVEEMARKDTRDVPVGKAVDAGVRGHGGEGEATEAPVVATTSPADPDKLAHFRGVGRVRSAPWPRQETHADWTDEDTIQYGIEPRTGPGVDPGQSS